MGKISNTKVSLSFRSDALIPEDVSAMLGCQPTQAARTGEHIALISKTIREVRQGFWRLEYDAPLELEIDAKIEAILARLTPEIEVWNTLAQSHKIVLFCGVFLDAWNEGFVFPSRLVEELGKRHIRLELDVYSPAHSWPDAGSDLPDEQA